jgi:hypothetical protein
VPIELRLFKNRNAVEANFKASATGRDHLDDCIRPPILELSRQTGGSGLVVSNNAVFDRDFHICRCNAC